MRLYFYFSQLEKNRRKMLLIIMNTYFVVGCVYPFAESAIKPTIYKDFDS